MATPSLFAEPAIDRAALESLAARSVPRAALTGTYVCVGKSTDLHDLGYGVAHWVVPGVPGSEVLEYNPRLSDLPRVTAATYAEQVAVHEAIGARVVGPGRKFHTRGHARAS